MFPSCGMSSVTDLCAEHLRERAALRDDFGARLRGISCDQDHPGLFPRSVNLPLSFSPLHTIW